VGSRCPEGGLFSVRRLVRVRYADRIIVLNHGTIAEAGTHSELVNKPGGLYASMWATQLQQQRKQRGESAGGA
jgi:ABC-type transport system involved in cytochrome bd biosynthesis fused ATPase/permease subunit